jgi:hypothetical protein
MPWEQPPSRSCPTRRSSNPHTRFRSCTAHVRRRPPMSISGVSLPYRIHRHPALSALFRSVLQPFCSRPPPIRRGVACVVTHPQPQTGSPFILCNEQLEAIVYQTLSCYLRCGKPESVRCAERRSNRADERTPVQQRRLQFCRPADAGGDPVGGKDPGDADTHSLLATPQRHPSARLGPYSLSRP